MPTAVHRPVDLTRTRGARLPRLCLAVEVGRAPRTQMLLGEAAQCLLTAIGAPPVLFQAPRRFTSTIRSNTSSSVSCSR
ncbi:hypothetical protein AB0I84_41910, partial [Streptomyces spectabilis]|uniref:hypothetical protein n=1 Tax=Streptomyces spectabilis TaxID=68270 RepID=UPI0033DFCB44